MKLISAVDAAKLVQSRFTVLISGSGGGHAVPEAPLAAIETRFLAEGPPRPRLARPPRVLTPAAPCLTTPTAGRNLARTQERGGVSWSRGVVDRATTSGT